MQARHLPGNVIQTLVVDDDIVRSRQAGVAAGLRGNDCPDLCFLVVVTLHGPGDLQFLGYVHHQDAVAQAVLSGFEEQRADENHIG